MKTNSAREVAEAIVKTLCDASGLLRTQFIVDNHVAAITAELEKRDKRIAALREALESLRGMCLGAPELAGDPLYVLPIVERALNADSGDVE